MWPDPRHFTANVDRISGNVIEVVWPVEEYCPQNTLLDFNAFATSTDGSIQRPDYSFTKRFQDFTLQRRNAKYKITGTQNDTAPIQKGNQLDPGCEEINDTPELPVLLDPPQNVYGKLNLISPEEATLILTFRPPASHPLMIKNFTFKFNELGEKIVYQVTRDGISELDVKVPLNTTRIHAHMRYRGSSSLSRSIHVTDLPDASHSMKVSQLIRTQENPKFFLEIHPKSKFKYPGNYTVTVFTNAANQKRHIIPIIMPNFVSLAPKHFDVIMSGHNAEVTWGEPRMFGKSCLYRVLAKPTKENGVPVSKFAKARERKVIFKYLFPATEYTFTLETNCENAKQILTNLGTRKTGPCVPGKIRNLQILVVEPSVIKLSWDPPNVMEGDVHLYNYDCHHPAAKYHHKGTVNATMVTIRNVASGRLSCVVSTVSSVKDHDAVEEQISDPVAAFVPSNRQSNSSTRDGMNSLPPISSSQSDFIAGSLDILLHDDDSRVNNR
ncbi:hypothetical protein Aperf_G00000120088 [Anoplocephala perfoliata]